MLNDEDATIAAGAEEVGRTGAELEDLEARVASS